MGEEQAESGLREYARDNDQNSFHNVQWVLNHKINQW